MDEQLLRLVLPTKLLADLDRHLATEGSARTRADFVREAVEQRLLELRFSDTSSPEAAASGVLLSARSPRHPEQLDEDGEELWDSDPLVNPRDLKDTRLPEVAGATLADLDRRVYPVEPGPMFLHGRDYPSLWCAAWLARWTHETPLELSRYLHQVTEAALLLGASLGAFDRAGPLRVTAGFPTSARNPDSAAQTFQASAIGGLVRRRDGKQVVEGPLALWQVAQIFPFRDRTMIALTQIGVDLLTALEGLSLELPHPEEHARIFLAHLQEHAPGDFQDLRLVLETVAEEPRRPVLIERLHKRGLAGSEKLADVFAQSYVSRGREWGLIEPKLLGGRYKLTDRGRSVLG